jgi:tRNA threonylcarbamoyladenosine biosynthesis protein TsaE
MLELELDDEAETLALAWALAALLEAGDVIALEGELGAGKTTFTRGVVHGLGVPQDTAVTSPTFALLHQYRGRLPIVHADLYRLGDEAELEELGLDELIEDGSVLFVEWGRKSVWVANRAVLWIELEITADVGRRVRLIPRGPRGEALLSGLRKQLAR